MELYFLIDNLLCLEKRPVLDRILYLKPLIYARFAPLPLPTRPIHRLRFETLPVFEEMLLHGRVLVDVDAPPREDHPQPGPLRRPAFDVLAPQVRLDDLARLRVGMDQRLPGRGVDQERVVEPGLDPVIWLDPGELGER